MAPEAVRLQPVEIHRLGLYLTLTAVLRVLQLTMVLEAGPWVLALVRRADLDTNHLQVLHLPQMLLTAAVVVHREQLVVAHFTVVLEVELRLLVSLFMAAAAEGLVLVAHRCSAVLVVPLALLELRLLAEAGEGLTVRVVSAE